ncbi:MAG: hypothetical protein ACYDCQ_05315 [Dehalococcoidia bacterium]
MATEALLPAGNLQPAKGARPAFCVGVTGHRPNRLRNADMAELRGRIHECLAIVGRTVSEPAERRRPLAVISPLAEGADRLVAEEGLGLGFALHALLPFNRDEYERDFADPKSCRQFRQLLTQAETIEELAGSRQGGPDAYAEVGRVVLDLSNLLIAVWDGRAARGDGGTGQIVFEAIHRGLLTIWIRADPPHHATLLEEDNALGVREAPLSRLPLHLTPQG